MSFPMEDSPTHRIQCGWLRRALPPRHAGQTLSGLTVDRVLPRYTVSRLRRTRAEPVCRINWIRRPGTFPSCRLRRKLHGRSATWQATPLATPGAVPTRQRLDTLNGRFQEQARKSGREISFACNAIIYEQYAILYCIVGPTCQGPNG